MDFSFYPDDLNFSSVVQLPSLEARADFTVNFRVTDNLACLAEGTPALCRPDIRLSP